MSIDLTLPMISEACADGLIAWMQGKVGALNSMLQRTGSTLPIAAVTTAQVLLGDGGILPSFDVWITLQAGERESGQEFDINFELFGETDGRAYQNKYQATVTAYVHPNTRFADNPIADLAIRERVLSRLSDWLRLVCFNNDTALIIPLGSREYNVSPTFDSLRATMLDRLYRGEKLLGEGKLQSVPAVEGTLIGIVY